MITTRFRMLSYALALLLAFMSLLSLVGPPAKKASAAVSGFVTRSGSQLMLNGQPFRYSGPNIYWLALDENPVEYPTEFRVNNALQTAKEMGATVVRSHAAISFGCTKCIMPSLGTYNETAFQKLDYAIKAAGDAGLRLVLPLIDQYDYYHGGKKSWTRWFGYPDDGISYTGYEFYNKPEIISAFKQHLSVLLNRTNTYTGVKYKDDPTIMAWETGNELGWYDNPTAMKNWTQDIADYLKSIDSNHLVMDGTYGVKDAHLSISSVDIYSDHFYQWPAVGACCKGLSVTELNTQANKVQAAGKAMVVGEFAWNLETYGTLASFLSAIEAQPAIAGSNYWALFGQNDDYGYKVHNDGFTIYYPGTTTDMRTKAQQLRNHAYAMRGISVPAAGVPDAPLITGHQASGGKVQLKWRGAAAADKYTVERATAGASGPWTVVCNQCATDTSTPWTDSTSVSGTAYWYRVKAHNLAGVAGSYSPVYATGGTALPAPGAFTQSSPASGATGQSVLPTFSWNASSNAASYTLVVADNSSYTSPVINAGGLTSTSYAAGSALAYNKTYYWKVTAVNGTGSTAASNAGLTFTTAAQSTSAAVDSFDSYSSDSALQSAYVRNTDGGALTVTRDAANKNDGTYGMKFAYTIAASPANFAGATKQLGTADWSGATGLSLWLKPDGSNRTLTIQFKETSGELWETYYTLSGTTAGIVNLPFSSFNHPGWYSGGNGVKDLNTVKEYSIYVNQGSGTTGSSTIYLDAITAGQVGGGTQPPSDAIDSFDSYASNSALQAAYNMNSSGSAITPTLDTSLKSDGTSSMKLSYSITTGANYSGVIHPISASWSGKTGLSLWVKPDGSNRTLTVQFKEAGGEPWETTYALSGTTATTIQVPFSSFARPSWYSGGNSTRDLGSIAEINFYINQGSGSTGSSAINIDAVKTY
ncbi:carbohydrate binding domain-containing protein [Paenibacillus sp. BK720]|uniref:carbohydrate binding domain-containing protein n=1 Tax=Paenibacillus sp. BK720 TaxID=2587092 RepID=UPI001422B5D3|nr:hypothetical protein [Paenibacillus sp. BK720]